MLMRKMLIGAGHTALGVPDEGSRGAVSLGFRGEEERKDEEMRVSQKLRKVWYRRRKGSAGGLQKRGTIRASYAKDSMFCVFECLSFVCYCLFYSNDM